jgi:phosphoglycerate-specific signal transduction histidine kinase
MVRLRGLSEEAIALQQVIVNLAVNSAQAISNSGARSAAP